VDLRLAREKGKSNVMREFGVIYTRYWIHRALMELDDQPRLFGAYLLTGPHSNILGAYRLPIEYIQADFKWNNETVSKGFRNLSETGFAHWCRSTKWVFITKYLKWNPPQNPNQAKSIIKCFDECPNSFKYYNELVNSLLTYGKHLPEPFLNRLKTLPKPFRNQDQDQDQDQDQAFPSEKQPEAAHFSNKVGEEYRERIIELCQELRNKTNGKTRFNPWQWVQLKFNTRPIHPQAIIDALGGLLKYWDGLKRSPWAYADSIFKTRNQNYNEAEQIQEHEKLKTAMESFEKTENGKKISQLLGTAIKDMSPSTSLGADG